MHPLEVAAEVVVVVSTSEPFCNRWNKFETLNCDTEKSVECTDTTFNEDNQNHLEIFGYFQSLKELSFVLLEKKI